MGRPLTGMPRTIPIVPRAGGPAAADDAQEAALLELAIAAFGNRERAQRWLRRPRRDFGGLAPLEMLDTPAGARQVAALLRGLAAARGEDEA